METQTKIDRLQLWWEIMEDRALSYGAKGVLIYLLQNPTVKRLTVSALLKISNEKRHALTSLIKEVSESRYSKILELKS